MPDTFSLESGTSGRDFYASHYRDRLVREAEWLRRGATQKADSVERLLRCNGIEPDSILELGCGTGAVITQLQSRGLARRYYGVDYSEEAIAYLKSAAPAIECAVADITETPDPFGEESFDVVVLSHTVEHLEEPLRFLEAIRPIPFDHLIVEVPLENLFFGRMKSALSDRSRNPAGHVQFFTRRSFRKLVADAGYVIADERVYAPWFDDATLEFAYGSDRAIRRVHKRLTEQYLPRAIGPLWTRVYHAHHAVLCRSIEDEAQGRRMKVEG
jgi:SAM-dependent methyltransferase